MFDIHSCMLITKQSCNASQQCRPAMQACHASSQCEPPAQLSDGHVLPLLAACWACQAARRSCISVRRAAFAAASRSSASAFSVTLFTHTHQSYTLSMCDALVKSQDMDRQSAHERPLTLCTQRCSRFQRRPMTPCLHICQRFGRPFPDCSADLVEFHGPVLHLLSSLCSPALDAVVQALAAFHSHLPRINAPPLQQNASVKCGNQDGAHRATAAASGAAAGATCAPPTITGACDRKGGRTTRARTSPATSTSVPSSFT